MDGFALRAEATFGAGPDRAISLRIGRDSWPINTGRPMLSDTDAVIMIENVDFLDDETFEIEQALVPWENVRRVGEDFVASEMILPGHHLVSAYELGALTAAGVFSLKVIEKPRVLLVPTGSELVSGEALGEREPSENESLEYNTIMLKGLVEEAGGIGIRTPIVRDEYEVVKAAIIQGVRSDAHLVVINAGSSAGSEDYTAAAIKELGEVLVHGVAMMPGKPTILGIVDGKPVIGNPGTRFRLFSPSRRSESRYWR